jgi:hypothetical protein
LSIHWEHRPASLYDAIVTLSVAEIAAMNDPVLRNLHITQRYHELALQLRDKGLDCDATWCAFAVWASKTAGATIRGEELPSGVRELIEASTDTANAVHKFNHGLEAWLARRLEHSHLIRIVDDVSDEVSAAIAAGNLLVFSELAPLFTAMLAGQDIGPLLDDLDAQGVDTEAVRQAFGHYTAAMDHTGRKCTSVLAANILAVSHEQERLQPNIETALNAAVHDIFVNVVKRDFVLEIPKADDHNFFHHLLGEVGSLFEHAWQSVLTGIMLRLVTPGQVFDLHDNVPPLDEQLFPPELANLDGSPAAAPYSQWDRTEGSGRPSGADDWADIGERMNYIVTLFRSRQHHPALFDPPFTDDQLVSLADGRLPEGPL